jgi:NAD(P)H-hydrate epimerase
MTGAAVMSVRGAERAGCGITFLATSAGAAPAVDITLTETIVYGVREGESGGMGAEAAEEILGRSEKATALVVGPGIGSGEEGRFLVEALLAGTDLPVYSTPTP